MKSHEPGDRADGIDMVVVEFIHAIRRMNVLPRQPCDEAFIAAREQVLGRIVPSELRVMYSKFDGVEVRAMPVTSQGIRVWPLNEVRVTGPRESGTHGTCLVFADYLLSSIEYGYNPETSCIVLLNGPASQVVASDLADFLRKCIEDRRSIYGDPGSS
jgi:hypothetical protein